MFKYSIYLLLAAIIQLNSCKSTAQSNLQESDDVGMELILNENYSGFEQEKYFLIKSQKELSAFYGKINRTRKPGLTPPKINFDSEMILVWCGDSSATNYANFKVSEKDEFIELHKLKSNTSEEESKLVVSPFSMYKLPLSPKSLKIKK
ncbi:hypothetical protein CSC80_10385 [Maribacter sp. 6B07]|uniref:hypothetical protein n=1 Tax=Maribacter sp. 6B07 TaxID=2045442 RepID=UPI000C073D62|nr:hypothetical protein [Maribacter sp. 6B07]PHN93329.1 hypothetical protein CSC80_10385 [Maribacter sp. 6B07]